MEEVPGEKSVSGSEIKISKRLGLKEQLIYSNEW
jgi:hypothetical protein